MTWRPMDFDGIINLNQTIVDQLQQYLDSKESLLGKVLLTAVNPYHSSQIPPPSISHGVKIRLSEAVEGLGRQIRQISHSSAPMADPNDWKSSAKKINQALWEYLETLEECVTELSQQLNMLGIEDWRKELVHIVKNIKELLIHCHEDFIWALKRIETQLKEYRWLCEAYQGKWVGLRKIFLAWDSILDRSLFANAEKCQKFLSFNYQTFVDKYKHLYAVQGKIDQLLDKFNRYKVFSTLDDDAQQKLKKIYQLVKLWEMNEKARFLPRQEPIRALRSLAGADKALALFKEYFESLLQELFTYSNAIKENPYFLMDSQNVERTQDDLLVCRGELHTLGSTVSKYRDFLLRTDPNPYVRSRLGFPEWIVGPEPSQTKQMQALIYAMETLDQKYEAFRQAIERKAAVPDALVADYESDIHSILHDMSQPLQSQKVLRLKSERLMNLLEQLDELNTSNRAVVPYIGDVLGKALRADWKYQTLFSIPAFHQIYAIHNGLLGGIEDRKHLNRMHKFKKLTQQISQWIKDRDTPRHMHEIELDMNDIKGYLQDFLGQVQRLSLLSSPAYERSLIERELLEYRYLFGNFFNHLKSDKPEERMIRKQFLFVDQYFEAIENKLHEQKLKEEQDREQAKEESEEKDD